MAKTKNSNNPTQELAQQVCQRYGWSAVIEKCHEDGSPHYGKWTCTVTLGLHEKRTFVCEDCTSPEDDDTVEGRKEGIRQASRVALEGLRDDITRQQAKPVQSLSDIFPTPIDVYESNDENWNYFWQHKPAVVGIDVEGNQISPPILVQISTDDYTILEVPSHQTISKHLQRLLQDTTIVKVFCDNFSHKDKQSLGLVQQSSSDQGADYTTGHIVDLEALASQYLGPVKVPRGLSKIVALILPECQDVLIGKPTSARERFQNNTIQRFALMEQGKKPRLQSLRQLSRAEQQYAALDSWCTLRAYQSLRQQVAAVETNI